MSESEGVEGSVSSKVDGFREGDGVSGEGDGESGESESGESVMSLLKSSGLTSCPSILTGAGSFMPFFWRSSSVCLCSRSSSLSKNPGPWSFLINCRWRLELMMFLRSMPAS